MKLKTLHTTTALMLLIGLGACVEPTQEVQNDSNTPLHLLQPAYKVPYGPLAVDAIKQDMDRVLRYLEEAKHAWRDAHWEEDLQKAYDAGRKMAEQ